MTWSDFFSRTKKLAESKSAYKAIVLTPKLASLPLAIQRYDEPFYPFSKELIQATKALVSVYIFDFASYLSTGAAGVVALERAMHFAKQDAVVVLHGSFTGTGYSVLADNHSFGVDAITVAQKQDMDFYLNNPPYAPILIANPQADDIIQAGGILEQNKLSLYCEDETISFKVFEGDFISQFVNDNYLDNIRKHIE